MKPNRGHHLHNMVYISCVWYVIDNYLFAIHTTPSFVPHHFIAPDNPNRLYQDIPCSRTNHKFNNNTVTNLYHVFSSVVNLWHIHKINDYIWYQVHIRSQLDLKQGVSPILAPTFSNIALFNLSGANATIYVGQHWFSQWLLAWWQQTITWIRFDYSSVTSGGIGLMVISQERLMTFSLDMSFEITNLRFQLFASANELTFAQNNPVYCVVSW